MQKNTCTDVLNVREHVREPLNPAGMSTDPSANKAYSYQG